MNEIVSSTEMDAIFEDTFGIALVRRGFERIDNRKWVRSTKQPIRELVRINALKGACYCAVWGFSLDFVPEASGSAVRWHRSPKTAIFDLCYDPLNYETTSNEWGIPSMEGHKVAREESVSQAKWVVDLAMPWFDSVHGDLDLIREFEAKKQRPYVRFGFYNYVQSPLAYAIVLSRVGRVDEARAELKKYCESNQVSGEISSRLFDLLNKN